MTNHSNNVIKFLLKNEVILLCFGWLIFFWWTSSLLSFSVTFLISNWVAFLFSYGKFCKSFHQTPLFIFIKAIIICIQKFEIWNFRHFERIIYCILTKGSKELRDLQNSFFFCYWSFFEQILSQPRSILFFQYAKHQYRLHIEPVSLKMLKDDRFMGDCKILNVFSA